MSYQRGGEGFGLKIDLDQLVWLHLQKIATAFEAPEFASSEQHTQLGGTKASSGKVTLERFENAVLAVYDLILPEWVESDNAKWPDREAAYWGQKAFFEKKWKEYTKALEEWRANPDPMKHPSRPLEPVEPKPFQDMADAAWNKATSQWQPFKLHAAIIQLLHRKGFFRDKTQVAVIEGTLEQEEATAPTSSSDTPATDGTSDKSISELSAAS
jgi:hypothetical protein